MRLNTPLPREAEFSPREDSSIVASSLAPSPLLLAFSGTSSLFPGLFFDPSDLEHFSSQWKHPEQGQQGSEEKEVSEGQASKQAPNKERGDSQTKLIVLEGKASRAFVQSHLGKWIQSESPREGQRLWHSVPEPPRLDSSVLKASEAACLGVGGLPLGKDADSFFLSSPTNESAPEEFASGEQDDEMVEIFCCLQGEVLLRRSEYDRYLAWSDEVKRQLAFSVCVDATCPIQFSFQGIPLILVRLEAKHLL